MSRYCRCGRLVVCGGEPVEKNLEPGQIVMIQEPVICKGCVHLHIETPYIGRGAPVSEIHKYEAALYCRYPRPTEEPVDPYTGEPPVSTLALCKDVNASLDCSYRKSDKPRRGAWFIGILLLGTPFWIMVVYGVLRQ